MRNLVIGGITIDIEGSPSSKLLYHDSNLGHIKVRPGGVGRNIATNMSLLGLEIEMISAVGTDDMGKTALEDLKKHNIGSNRVLEVSGYSTSIYLSILNDKNDMELALNDMEVIKCIDVDFIYANYDYIDSFDLILLDANLEKEVIDYIARTFSDKILVADSVSVAKSDRIKDSLKYLYAIKPNVYEAECLTSIKIRDEEDIKAAAYALISMGVKNVFLTLDKDGVYYTNGSESGFLRPKDNLTIKSATGAGDSFTASIILGINKGFDIRKISSIGMTAAEITMESDSSINENLSYKLIKERGKIDG